MGRCGRQPPTSHPYYIIDGRESQAERKNKYSLRSGPLSLYNLTMTNDDHLCDICHELPAESLLLYSPEAVASCKRCAMRERLPYSLRERLKNTPSLADSSTEPTQKVFAFMLDL